MRAGLLFSALVGLLLIISGVLFWLAGQQAQSNAASAARLCATDPDC